MHGRSAAVERLSEVQRAAELEASDPRRARKLYRSLQSQNRTFDVQLLLLSAGTMTLAGALTLLTKFRLDAAAILILVGIAPPTLLRIRRAGHLTGNRAHFTVFWVFKLAEKHLAGQFLRLYRIALRVSLMLAPVAGAAIVLGLWWGKAGTDPQLLRALGYLTLLAIGMAVVLDVAQLWFIDLLPPATGLRILASGLWINRSEVISLGLGLLTAALVFVPGRLSLVQGSPSHILGASAICGLFLGHELATASRSSKIGDLVGFGLLRCDLRLGNEGRAGYRLRELWRIEKSLAVAAFELGVGGVESLDGIASRPQLHLARALAVVADRMKFGDGTSPKAETHLIRASKTSAAAYLPDSAAWRASIEATRALARGDGRIAPRRPRGSRGAWTGLSKLGRIVYSSVVACEAGAALGLWLGSRIGGGLPTLAGLLFGALFGLGLAPVGLRLVDLHRSRLDLTGG